MLPFQNLIILMFSLSLLGQSSERFVIFVDFYKEPTFGFVCSSLLFYTISFMFTLLFPPLCLCSPLMLVLTLVCSFYFLKMLYLFL